MACTINAQSRVGCSTEWREGDGDRKKRKGGVCLGSGRGEYKEGDGEEVLKKKMWSEIERKRERERIWLRDQEPVFSVQPVNCA